jgi:hypothetical protein
MNKHVIFLLVATGVVAVASPKSSPKVTWTNQVPLKSLSDIDAQLLVGFDENPVSLKSTRDGSQVTVKNCNDYLALTANGGDFEASTGSDYLVYHSNGLWCHTLELLKNAHPAKTTFLKDFKFDKDVVGVLSPRIALLQENADEAQTAERGLSLKDFEPSLKVTASEENKISVETKTWTADISYLAHGDFEGKGVDEVLIERKGTWNQGEGPQELNDALFILTRTKDSGPLHVVREIR